MKLDKTNIFLEQYLFNDVKQLICSELSLSPIFFENLYNHFLRIYKQEDSLKEFNATMHINKLKNFDQSIISQKNSYGIDLPVWFSAKNKKRKKIMLVGMDPLRDKNETGLINEIASLNSPYSIHNRVKNNYYPSISLLAENYDIYITDVFKLFFREPKNSSIVSNQNSSFRALKIHTKLLEKEIKLFSPDIVLCMGKQPVNDGLAKIGLTNFIPSIVTKVNNISLSKIPIYAIPHATGLASKHAKKFMVEKNNSKYNSKTYILDAVNLIINK